MILSEEQSLQLAGILIEASEDEGKKEGLLSKVKSVFKRVIDWVKEKIKKLKDFIKEKVSKVANTLLKPVKKILGNSKFVQELNRSYKEKHLKILRDDNHIKKYFTDVEKINDEIQGIAQEISNIAISNLSAGRMVDDASGLIEKLDAAIAKLSEAMENYDEMSDNFMSNYRQKVWTDTHASTNFIGVALDASLSLFGEATPLTNSLEKRLEILVRMDKKAHKNYIDKDYRFNSRLAFALGKLTSAQVNFFSGVFSKFINILKALVAPVLNFFKKKKAETQSTGGSSENLPAIV